VTTVLVSEETQSVVVIDGDALVLEVTQGGLSFPFALGNGSVTGFKTATFQSQPAGSATAGPITLDWSAAQNQRQPEPSGAISYTFVNPPGPCHLQLLIDSDGSSVARAFTWPSSLTWFGAVWEGAANKKSIINFWFDGTAYSAMGVNQA